MKFMPATLAADNADEITIRNFAISLNCSGVRMTVPTLQFNVME